MRKTIALTALAAAMIATGAGPAAAADGTFRGSAAGHNDVLEVDVTVKDGKIEKIDIVSSHETPAISELPKKAIPQLIVGNQTLKVDRIAGATFTSLALVGAVKDALKKAGIDPAEFGTGRSVAYSVPIPADRSADVVVVGGGGSGMAAAVAAARVGASVILVEKMSFLGGNTIHAGGALNASDPALEGKQKMSAGQRKMVEDILAEAPRNRLHGELIAAAKAKFEAHLAKNPEALFDCEELHALQTWKAGDYAASLELVTELAKKAPQAVERLKGLGFEWNDFSSQYVGAIWPRCHDALHYTSGEGYIATYRATIEKENLPVKFFLQTKAEELLKEGGRVTGVKVTGPDGRPLELKAAKGVVLASGGFGASVEMRMKYDGQWGGLLDGKFPTTNSRAITGEAILMAARAGAQLVDMGYIQLLPVADPETGRLTGICQGTAIYVNPEGRRFVNEMGRRDELSKAALAQTNGLFWRMCTVANSRVKKDGSTTLGQSIDTLVKTGKVIRGENVEDLARQTRIDPKVLRETFDRFNDFCRKQAADPDFGRPSCGPDIPMYEGPFYAELRTPAVHHTMGGVKIDTSNRVIGADGSVIAGLYAAGEVTGGIHGTNRVGGNAIADAMAFGWAAGEQAASGR